MHVIEYAAQKSLNITEYMYIYIFKATLGVNATSDHVGWHNTKKVHVPDP